MVLANLPISRLLSKRSATDSKTNSQPLPAQTIQRYLDYLRKYRTQVVVALCAMPVLVVVQNGLLPLVYSKVIDRLHQTNGHLQHFGGWLALFISMHLIVFTGQRVTSRLWSNLEHSAIKDMEQHIFVTLLQQSNHFHATTHAGGLVAQAKRFTGAFSALMMAFYNNAYALLFRLLVAFGFMLFMAPTVAAVLLVWTAVYMISIYWLTKKKMHASEAAAAADSLMTAHLADTITNTAAVKLFASEELEMSAYRKLSTNKFMRRRKDWLLSEYILAWQSLLMIILETTVLALSVKLVENHTFTLGKLALIQFFLAPIMTSLWQIANVFRQVETAFSEAGEMTEVLALEPSIKDPARPVKAKIEKGDIRFSSVSFSYMEDKQRRQLFQNFDLHITPGQRVGLVGPSGSGKSSLTKLLMRFEDIDGGVIMIDGNPINVMRQTDLRRQIAFVPQEPQLFHRTIAQNIRYSKPTATDEEVIEAAKRAKAHDFIMRLPEGYDTMVGERGSKLSGGERQRVAIARAMLKDAPVVVLDEATSALDSESEKHIQKAFDNLIEGRTAIVIAHRLSTIQHMDRIIVLKDGDVVEDGSHEQLLRHRGLYAELWAHQTGESLPEEQSNDFGQNRQLSPAR